MGNYSCHIYKTYHLLGVYIYLCQKKESGIIGCIINNYVRPWELEDALVVRRYASMLFKIFN